MPEKTRKQTVKKAVETEDIRSQIRREFASEGGKARAKSLSPAQRREIARKAIRSRWDAVRRKLLGAAQREH